MYNDQQASSSLTVASNANSPGSSVFDLPTQITSNPQVTTTLNDVSTTVPTGDHDTTVDNRAAPSYLVISGGTGGNAICSAFNNACYVLPVSDDGGSSSEIIRVLGGPSVGDIRSRLIRLIPPAPSNAPLDAIRRLLSYRLPSGSSDREARDEWRDIVEGRSRLWKGIPIDRKETIRGKKWTLCELLKRAHKNFSFRNGSIGNYFLAAAQGFFRSLPSAIFLFSSITNSQANILPVIVTNHTVTIAADLEDGERLVGQCEISHPMAPLDAIASDDTEDSFMDGIGDPPIQTPSNNVLFEAVSKGDYEPLRSRICRLYYINGYGMEIQPSPNPDFLANIASRDVLVYSCGSLWTRVIVKTLNDNYSTASYGLGQANTTYPISAFITDLVYLNSSRIAVDEEKLAVSKESLVILTNPAD
ncbi:hypothetical protein CVT24_003518 [Panaeolus cyanescens]|uniref:Uncharacterized protein n=1 Tax=Panaeolus cyanescens TaxID=181874 RepID=A0A409Y781_9AGAR|nr:hypothetical protein CVT24_003518 [Panaeolus cyanescens]